MVVVGAAIKDVGGGHESLEIALVTDTRQSPQRSLGLFAEYIPRCVVHDSLLENVIAPKGVSRDEGSDSRQSPGSASSESMYGCSCSPQASATGNQRQECCLPEDGCECVAEHGNFYDAHSRLQLDALPPRHVLVECSELCACRARSNNGARIGSGTCANAVVSNGMRAPLEIRPTRSSGLGLYSSAPLARGTFICEFAGELISDEEASKRWQEYRALEIGNYILCINEGEVDAATAVRTTIDPTRRGNVARFINHLCPPLTNVVILPVRCDGHLPPLPPDAPVPPRAAIFAKRDIAAGEQLGYDYADAGGQRKEGIIDGEDGGRVTEEAERSQGRTECRCGSVRCRGWLPSAAYLI